MVVKGRGQVKAIDTAGQARYAAPEPGRRLPPRPPRGVGMTEQNRVQWVYSATTDGELAERYDEWAKDYDSELARDFGWHGPKTAVDVFTKYATDKGAFILDAGVGTGLVGELLAGMGYRNLEGLDLSKGMLAEARKRRIYRQLRLLRLGGPLGYPDNAFDGVISVGVMTIGHAPASSLDELVRIAKPGGCIVYTLRPDLHETGGFKEKHAELEAAGKWKLAEVTDPIQLLPKGEPEITHQVWAFEVTA